MNCDMNGNFLMHQRKQQAHSLCNSSMKYLISEEAGFLEKLKKVTYYCVLAPKSDVAAKRAPYLQ